MEHSRNIAEPSQLYLSFYKRDLTLVPIGINSWSFIHYCALCQLRMKSWLNVPFAVCTFENILLVIIRDL